MEALYTIGVMLLILTIIALPTGTIFLLASIFSRSKWVVKTGVYLLLASAIMFCLSISFCSMGRFSL